MAKREPSEIRVVGDIAYVALSRGFEAMIDASDVLLISDYRWCLNARSTSHAYAVAHRNNRSILMHRLLLDAGPGVHVDHIDGDGLNNRRGNIRLCNMTQNMANKIVERRNLLGIKGVSLSRGRYRAIITPNGQKLHLGVFDTPEEASAAYRGAAVVLWGDFAKK